MNKPTFLDPNHLFPRHQEESRDILYKLLYSLFYRTSLLLAPKSFTEFIRLENFRLHNR